MEFDIQVLLPFGAFQVTKTRHLGEFQDPKIIKPYQGLKSLKIGEFQSPNTHPIGDFYDPTCQHHNGEIQGLHPTLAQIVGGPTLGLGAADKWMMVTKLGW